MIQSFYEGVYYPTTPGNPICNCCGSILAGITQVYDFGSRSYQPKMIGPKEGERGLEVLEGTHGEEEDSEFFQVSHINTSNGPLTISVRTKWPEAV